MVEAMDTDERSRKGNTPTMDDLSLLNQYDSILPTPRDLWIQDEDILIIQIALITSNLKVVLVVRQEVQVVPTVWPLHLWITIPASILAQVHHSNNIHHDHHPHHNNRLTTPRIMDGDPVSRHSEVGMEMEGITMEVAQPHQVMLAEVLHLKRPPRIQATKHTSLLRAKEDGVVDEEEENLRVGILFVNNQGDLEMMAGSGGLRRDERKTDAHWLTDWLIEIPHSCAIFGCSRWEWDLFFRFICVNRELDPVLELEIVVSFYFFFIVC
jgi:hypothetical protein